MQQMKDDFYCKNQTNCGLIHRHRQTVKVMLSIYEGVRGRRRREAASREVRVVVQSRQGGSEEIFKIVQY